MSDKSVAKGKMTARKITQQFYTHERYLPATVSALMQRLLGQTSSEVNITHKKFKDK